MYAPDTSAPARTLQIAVLGAQAADCSALAQALSAQCQGHHNPLAVTLHAQAPLQQRAQQIPADDSAADAAETSVLALQHRSRFALTLLLGLDTAHASPADAWLRDTLGQARIDYQVLYGGLPAQLQQGLQAIQALTTRRPPSPPPAHARAPASEDAPMRMRAWGCEKCSDPACEHALFQQLLQKR